MLGFQSSKYDLPLNGPQWTSQKYTSCKLKNHNTLIWFKPVYSAEFLFWALRSSISTIAIESYVNYTNDRRLETCTMSFQAIFPSYCITCGMFSYMSVVRYYLASKMQELEAVKALKLYLVAGIIFASEHAYIPISYLLAIDFDIPSGATECAGNNGKRSIL